MKKMSKGLRYYYRNRERLIQYSKDFHKKHPEKRRENHKKYLSTAKGIFCQIKKTRKDKLNISQKEFIEWYDNSEKICSYCGISVNDINEFYEKFPTKKCRSSRLTIDRMDNTKGYDKGNLTLACDICNRVKSDIFTYNEMVKIGKIIRKKYKSK